MNTALVALELRKNRLTLIGLGLSFAVVPPLSLLVAPRAALSATQAVESGLILWTLAGLPLCAVFLGAISGASLRDAAVRDAEAPFPGSPSSRVLRAFAGAALQLLMLTAATALLSAALSPGWRGAVLGAGEAPEVWAEIAPLRGLIAFLAFDLLAGSFLAAYVLGHALAGGLIGVALAAGEAVAFGLGLQFTVFYPDRVESFVPLAALAALAGLAAKAAAARPLASRFERSRPLGASGAAGTALLLACGLLAAWGAEESAYARLRSSLRLVKPGVASFLLTLGPSTDDAEAALYPAVRGAGALAATAGGGLFWIAPDGRPLRLLPDGVGGRFAALGPWRTRVEAALWDESGRLLVSRRISEASGDKTEFWAGRPERGLRPVDPALGTPEQIVREGGAAGIRFGRNGEERFCPMDDDGRARTCAPSISAWSSHRSFETQSYPLAARVSKDGLTLRRPGPRARAWRLPAPAADAGAASAPVLAYLVAGKPAYFVPVRIKDDEAMAVCFENGRIQTVWRHGWSGLRAFGGPALDVLPDGTLIYQYAYDWNVVDPSGTFLPPIRSKRLFERWPRPDGAPPYTPRLVRRAGGRAWIVFEGTRLVEMDESTGAPLKDWPLPAKAWTAGSYDGMRVLEGGLVIQEFRTPFFVGWDGAARALRAP